MNARLFRIALAVLLVAGITVGIAFREQLNTAAMEQWIGSFGMAGPLVFMAIYAIGTVLFFPGAVLTLAGGAVFGPVWGTLFTLPGATFGATLAFLIARYIASGWVERKSGGRLMQLKNGVEGEGWRFIAFGTWGESIVGSGSIMLIFFGIGIIS